MEILWIGTEGAEHHDTGTIDGLLARDSGFLWIDLPVCDGDGEQFLSRTFGFHSLALRDCRERSHLPKFHAYPDHLFLVLHSPEPGDNGSVHLLEVDQFVSLRYLITVHGPLGEGVDPSLALRETRAVRERIESGRFKPVAPGEVSHAITAAIASRLETYVGALASRVAVLERAVLKSASRDPEEALEEMFRLRHELLTVRTMAAGSREVCARMSGLARFLPEEGRPYVEDLVDRFDRVRSLADGEREFLQGVVDFHQSRVATKMNIAMERLALLAAVMMPITAVAGIYGMNIITSDRTDPVQIGGVLGVMALVSAAMLRWAKRHGWW